MPLFTWQIANDNNTKCQWLNWHVQIIARRNATDYIRVRTYSQREMPMITLAMATNRHAKCRYLNAQLQIIKTRHVDNYIINCK